VQSLLLQFVELTLSLILSILHTQNKPQLSLDKRGAIRINYKMVMKTDDIAEEVQKFKKKYYKNILILFSTIKQIKNTFVFLICLFAFNFQLKRSGV